MLGKIFLLLSLLTYTVCSGQSYIEQVDGEKIVTEQTYYSDSIQKKETAANDYIGLYQKYISGIRGQECPMYPSCSNYGLKTFNETNFATAFVLTSDRMLRCGHDHSNYSLTLRKNGFKYIDYPAYDTPPSDFYYSSNSYYFAYSDTIKDETSYLFIKKLINNQYYNEALLEIMRLEFQSNTFEIDLFVNKIICLKAIGEYEKALFEYETKCPPIFKNNVELLYQIALIQYKLDNFDQALKINKMALASCKDTFCKPKIVLLDGLLHAKKYDWESAKQSYQSIADLNDYKKISSVNFQLSDKGLLLKDKSPKLAGIISIIPGAGYAYTGHKQTAVSAFIVNGLLAYATYSSFRNKNYGMGILTGVFNFSFYLGNIYGATKSAKRYNEQQRKSIINKLIFNTQF